MVVYKPGKLVGGSPRERAAQKEHPKRITSTPLQRRGIHLKHHREHVRVALPDKVHRRKSPARFVDGCNWVKPHKAPGNLTPGEKLRLYLFSQDFPNNS